VAVEPRSAHREWVKREYQAKNERGRRKIISKKRGNPKPKIGQTLPRKQEPGGDSIGKTKLGRGLALCHEGDLEAIKTRGRKS